MFILIFKSKILDILFLLPQIYAKSLLPWYWEYSKQRPAEPKRTYPSLCLQRCEHPGTISLQRDVSYQVYSGARSKRIHPLKQSQQMYNTCAMWTGTWPDEVLLQGANACNEYASRDLVSWYKMSLNCSLLELCLQCWGWLSVTWRLGCHSQPCPKLHILTACAGQLV